jgi:hypothetical protein
VGPRFGGAPRRAVRALLVSTLPAALLLIACPNAASAGAWARDHGEAYAKASISYLEAEEMYDDSGRLRPIYDPGLYENPRYTEHGSALYVEYGLFRSLTLVGSVPLKLAEQDAVGINAAADIHGETFGFGDLHLGARVPLVRGRWAAAIEPDLKIPLRRAPEEGSPDPALSTGFTDFGASLYLGASLPRVHGYGQGSFGYRIRSGNTAEEEYWDLEVGVEPTRVLRVRFRYDGVHSEGGSQAATGPNPPAPSAGEQDYDRIAPTLAIGLGESQELSLTWRRVVDGRSTIGSDEWELAYSFLGRVVPFPKP